MIKIKNTIASLLCSNFVGRILARFYNDRIPARRYGKFVYDCSSELILNSVKASIFWGIYESAEIRFIKKYLRNDIDVIELGASIGVVSSHILRVINVENRLVSLEANPHLIKTLQNNLNINNKNHNYIIINKAISYKPEDEVNFYLSDKNVASSINKTNGTPVKLKGIKLSELLLHHSINEYALICDIEGSEIEIIINEADYLLKCQQMIIELHATEFDGKKYKTEDMVKIITENTGLEQIDRYGEVYYFLRISS